MRCRKEKNSTWIAREKRGGGISSIELRNKTQELANYYQLHCTFETLDAMGANFINSCLEQIAETFTREAENYFSSEEQPEVVMSILSNYVPQCLVRAEVSCPVEDLLPNKADAEKFAHKFVEAVKIAKIEPYRDGGTVCGCGDPRYLRRIM